PSLFRRMLDKSEARPIEGAEAAEAVFSSPDDRWIGFVANNKLMKFAVEGGRPLEIADSAAAGGTWLPDDTIVFAPIYSDGLFRMPAAGGTRERLTTPDRADGVLGHFYPEALPGGRQVIFTAFRTPVDRSRIGVVDLTTRQVRWIVE